VSITNIPGYLPMRNNAVMQEVYLRNARELVGDDSVLVRPAAHNGGGSTDMGDLAQIIPLIHPYCGGATGTGHGADYVIQDYDTAVIAAAKAMAMTVIDLLANGAQKAKEIKATDKAPMTKEQYLRFQRDRAEVVRYDGAKA
jgi:metal-dependent amidase/aminoacylase/carboxypeptidase family protein